MEVSRSNSSTFLIFSKARFVKWDPAGVFAYFTNKNPPPLARIAEAGLVRSGVAHLALTRQRDPSYSSFV